LALFAALAVMIAAGCSEDDEKSSDAAKTESVPTATGPPETVTTPEGAREEVPAAALAGSQGQIDDDPVRLDIVELKRSGQTTALTLRLTIVGEGGSDSAISAQVASTFDDGIFQSVRGGTSTSGGGSMDGISLIDSRNGKRYLVARDERGECVCDTDLGSAFVEPQSPLLLSATFGAPPSDVDAVDVVIPRFGTFKDVPLS
jgi:hypothetical protein